jgi:integrase
MENADMRKLLTDKGIAATRPPATGRTQIFDTVRTGLCFRITANNVRSWSHVYRYGGEWRRDSLGAYPKVGLARARELARDAQEAIGRGDDPRTLKAGAEAAAAQTVADTITAIGERFIAKHAAQRRWRELERVMRRDVMPRWGDRPLASVTRRDVIELVDGVVDRGSPVQANRTLVVLKIFFGWCVDRDIIDADPTARVKKPTKEIPRERTLTAPEIAAFWHICDDIGEPFGSLFKLLLLTAQRKSEIAHLEWSEIQADKRRIEIAGAKYKTGRPHAVPLSEAAWAILSTRPKIEGCKYVFSTNGTTPVSGFSKAKAQIDTAMKEDRVGATIQGWRLHDLRRTARSGLSELGIRPDIGERILGHVIGGVAGIYDRGSYEPQMRHALEAWAAHVEAVVNPPPKGKVVRMRGAG